MGNATARPGLATHHTASWSWNTVVDPIQLSVFRDPKDKESDQVIRLHVIIPFGRGNCREDIRVTIKHDVLIISGVKPLDKDISSNTLKQLLHKYSTYTSFERSLPLPSSVDVKSIEARWLHDGLLEIVLPHQGKDLIDRDIDISDVPALKDSNYTIPYLTDQKYQAVIPISDPKDEGQSSQTETKGLPKYGEEKPSSPSLRSTSTPTSPSAPKGGVPQDDAQEKGKVKPKGKPKANGKKKKGKTRHRKQAEEV